MTLITSVLAGTSAILLAALIRERFERSRAPIIPSRGRPTTEEAYRRLNGTWVFYYVSNDHQVGTEPLWIEGHAQLEVQRSGRVVGSTRLTGHPRRQDSYRAQGEILGNRLLLADSSEQDPTDFASLIFPNLSRGDTLVGIWTGMDNDGQLIGAPAVFSRSQLSAKALHKAVTGSQVAVIYVARELKLYVPTNGEPAENGE